MTRPGGCAAEGLPADLRLPLVLHYFVGQPLAAIAELCDLPLSTVKQRMRVARARLPERWDGRDGRRDGVPPAT